jgi:hypothetical protein
MKTEVDLDNLISNMQLPYTVAPLQYFDAITGYREGRYALFYDVGGGKTLVSTLIAMLFDYQTIVVMPHILIRQWQRWLKRVRVPDNQVYVYYGPKRDIQLVKSAKWILTSHAIFRQDSKKIQEAFTRRKVTVLFDEAQALKSIKSKLFKATASLVSGDNPFVPMSATPTAKPEDTYAYMKLKTPGLYRSFSHWEGLHVKERDFFGGIKSYANLELLRDNFAIRAAKRDKKELFGYSDDMKPILDPIEYELAPKHLKLYRKLVNEQLLELPNGDKVDGTTAQRLRHMMQQIVWNPAAFSGDPTDVAAGFELLEQLCEEVNFMPEGRSKFVIWTYYRSTSEAIFNWMRTRYGDTGVIAYGGGNSQKAVDAIMFEDKCRWSVFNPMSVGAGLELQHVCWEMFFAEMVTTPIPNRQAFGRVDRPGQKYRPTIRFGQAIGTVQKQLFEDLLRNDERAAFVERTRTSLRQELLGGMP